MDNLKSLAKDLVSFFKNPENKEIIKSINFIARTLNPHPVWKIIGDIVISAICIGVVLYCADKEYIEKTNIQSLLTLVIGAIIGARFKTR